MSWKRAAWWLFIFGVGFIAFAWLHGGRESVHPIAEAVPLPSAAQGGYN